MATWLTHLRVADRLYDKIKINDSSLFFAGSIAPDCNISPDITHWCINGDKTTCDVYNFFCKYILNFANSIDFDFYLGYYIHLLTDILWHKQKIEPLKRCNKNLIKKVKESWKSIDYNFLSDQNNYRPLIAISETVKYEKKWFDYFSINQIKELCEYIISSCNNITYEESCVDIVVKNEIEQFIEEASGIIFLKL